MSHSAVSNCCTADIVISHAASMRRDTGIAMPFPFAPDRGADSARNNVPAQVSTATKESAPTES